MIEKVKEEIKVLMDERMFSMLRKFEQMANALQNVKDQTFAQELMKK